MAAEPASVHDHPVTEISENGGATMVRLAGELDLYNVDRVRAALLECVERGTRRLIVDVSEVTFVDSTALGVFVEARGRLGPGGFVLLSPGLETRRALEISGLDRVLVVSDSIAEALAPTRS
jgi:anti-sigma B factor antagonist